MPDSLASKARTEEGRNPLTLVFLVTSLVGGFRCRVGEKRCRVGRVASHRVG